MTGNSAIQPLTHNKRVVVFGGSGFIGRAIVRQLLDLNYGVRVMSRDVTRVTRHAMEGQVGQLAYVAGDITRDEDVARAMAGMDMVVNCVGILNEPWWTRVKSEGSQFEAIHHRAAARIAREAAAQSVQSLVHVSALGAAVNSPSHYGASKARGERAVLRSFEGAVIVRPSVVFGTGDGFINLFARMARWMMIVPVFGESLSALWRADARGGASMQPIFVEDLATGIVQLLHDEKRRGSIIEAVGVDVCDMRTIMQWIVTTLGVRRWLMPCPHWVLWVMGQVGSYVPFSPFTKEQALMLRHDAVATNHYESLQECGVQLHQAEELMRQQLRNRFMAYKKTKGTTYNVTHDE